MMKVFNHAQCRYPTILLSENSGEICIDSTGYLPKETQLAILLQSGNAYDKYLAKIAPNYYNPLLEHPDEPDIDPTLDKDYGPMDAVDDIQNLNRAFEAAAKAAAPSTDPLTNIGAVTQSVSLPPSPPQQGDNHGLPSQA